jgi:NAD(P)-dependent dehydrogenase (short-subunit alcohol dehydrogenase family)
MSVPYVIITGDSDGLGNAVARAILRCSETVRVIGISRRADTEVVGYGQLSLAERTRYARVRADLSDPDSVTAALSRVSGIVADAGGRLRSLLLVNGTGFLDSQVRADPALHPLMAQLNVHAPVALVRGIQQQGALAEPGLRIFYYSGLVTHPNVTDPLLRMHAALKKQAVAQLRTMCGQRLTCVMPGAYMTPMLARTIVRRDSLLEWYALPIGDPYAKGGLADVVAKLAVSTAPDAPQTLIRPRISGLLVRQKPDRLLASLPAAIVRCARAVLAQTGQSDEEHDARVSYLQENRVYGEDFPYDRIKSDRLWPHWASVAYARLLSGLVLTR